MNILRTASPHQHPFAARDLAIAMLVNAAFALNIIAMKVVVAATAPLFAGAARMAVVTLLCGLWLRPVRGRTLALAAYGAINGGLFLLVLNLALNLATNVGALAIAGQLSVPFSLILGALIFREHLSRRKLAGVLLAFAGVIVLVFDPAAVGEIPALLVMAGAAFLWGSGTLIQRRLAGIDLLNIQAWNGLMGMLLLAPAALWFEPGVFAKLPHLGTEALAWFAFSCVGSTIIGQGALAWLLQRHPISTVMPLMLASPVMATAFAALYFRTPITAGMMLGGAIALAGVTIIAVGNRRGS